MPKLFTCKSEYPRSLKEFIPDSQALRIERICSTNSDFEARIDTIKGQLVKHGYVKALIGNQIKKVARLDRHGFFASQNKSKKASCLPLSVTYNGTLPKSKPKGHHRW